MQMPLGVVTAGKVLERETENQPVSVVINLGWGHHTGNGENNGHVDRLEERVAEGLLEKVERDGEEEAQDEQVVDSVVDRRRAKHAIRRDHTPDD